MVPMPIRPVTQTLPKPGSPQPAAPPTLSEPGANTPGVCTPNTGLLKSRFWFRRSQVPSFQHRVASAGSTLPVPGGIFSSAMSPATSSLATGAAVPMPTASLPSKATTPPPLRKKRIPPPTSPTCDCQK